MLFMGLLCVQLRPNQPGVLSRPAVEVVDPPWIKKTVVCVSLLIATGEALSYHCSKQRGELPGLEKPLEGVC